MKTERGIRKMWMISGLVLLLLCLSFMPGSPVMRGAKADVEKTEANTALGSGGIRNPLSSQGGWNYVYYGQYNGQPVKYRVLDAWSGDFGVEGGSMLLDCDTVLINAKFDADDEPNIVTGSINDWEDSDIRIFLNSSLFYGNDNVFTDGERAAIALSKKAGRAPGDGQGNTHLSFKPLTGDRVFLLDNAEASRKSYGYADRRSDDTNLPSYGRIKVNSETGWWLRSRYHRYVDGEENYAIDENGNQVEIEYDPYWDESDDAHYIGSIQRQGVILGTLVTDTIGISPVLNIARSRLLFTTADPSEGKTFTLTVLDESLSAAVTQGQQVTQNGNMITVPYTVTGEPNRISVLITTAEYNNGAMMKYYRSLEVSGGIGSSGTGTFTLPDNLAATDRIYIVAEKVCGARKTDYASVPVEIQLPSHTVTFDANGGTVTPEQITTGANKKLPFLPQITRDRHYHAGWFTAREGGEEITLDTVFDADQTVYAHWVPTWTITLDANGGSVLPTEMYANIHHKLTVLPTPTYAKHFFDGWYTSRDGGEKITTETIFNGDQTIYAHWIPLWTITLDAQGGSVSPAEVLTDKNGSLEALPTPTFEKHIFTGWFTESDGGREIAADQIFAADQTIYAHWIPLWTITLDANGGYVSLHEVLTDIHGRPESLPIPNNGNNRFVGWFTEREGGNEVTKDTVITADQTIYARWSVYYTDLSGKNHELQEGSFQRITSSEKNQELNGGWYIVEGNQTISRSLQITGTVNLVLCDHSSLHVNSIRLNPDNQNLTMTIWSQSQSTGTLVVNNGIFSRAMRNATLVINGGIITANSTKTNAAIGGTQHETGIGTNIEINGGIITAVTSFSSKGAAIGGGYHTPCGNITIRGGQVIARSENNCFIGPGKNGTPGTVTLSWTHRSDSIKTGPIIASTYVLEKPFHYYRNGQDCGEVTPEVLANLGKDDVLIPSPTEAGVTIEGGDQNLLNYLERELTATVADPGEGTGAFTWSSDAPEVAVIDQHTGKVIPIGTGTTKITAVYESETTRGEASILLTVVDRYTVTTAVAGDGTVTLSEEEPIPGETVTVTITPADGKLFDPPTVKCGERDIETTQTDANTYTFVMPEGDVLINATFREPGRFVVYFVNCDSRMLQWNNYTEGDDPPQYEGETPTYGPTAQYTFTFAGWDREITAVTGDAVYTATYTYEPRTYGVTFVNRDGTTVLQPTENLEWGETPEYRGETPKWKTDENSVYTFRGWTPQITPVRGETVYKATYDTAPVLKMGENNIFVKQWTTVSCPFTPTADGYYRFHTEPNPVHTNIFIRDGEGMNTGFTQYATENWEYVMDCAVYLEQGKEYSVEFNCYLEGANLKLIIEEAETYTITVVNDEDTVHGVIVESEMPDRAYAGQMIGVIFEPEEGYWVKEIIVKDAAGNRVPMEDPTLFAMPSSDVTVTGRFGELYPITVNAGEHIIPGKVDTGGLAGFGDEVSALSDTTVSIFIGWDDGYEVEAFTVTTADGTELPVWTYDDGESEGLFYQFDMPEGPVTVSVTARLFGFYDPDFTLPAHITRIEEEAFEGGDMSVVYIPDSCLSIGAHAFRNCRVLTKIRIPAGCEIGEGAFDGCGEMYIFSSENSYAKTYCDSHDNCEFVEE